MTKTKTSSIATIQLLEDRIEFGDNAKKLWLIRLAAVLCWLVFSLINTFRFYENPKVSYFMMSALALVAGGALGYSIFKETTLQSIPLSTISKVVVKKFPTNKIHGRVVTKNKKFRSFSIPKNEISFPELCDFFESKNILVQEG